MLAQRTTSERRATVLPAVRYIQANARGRAARMVYARSVSAARVLQSCWRMARGRVLGSRLGSSAARLRGGGLLFKYRGGGVGLKRERVKRFVWLTHDLQQLCWADAPPSANGGGGEGVRMMPMEHITAVSTGCKTEPLKRALLKNDGGSKKRLPRLGARTARPLDEACAFSIIGRERVLDFVADDSPTARRWLSDLRTILTFGHHLDHKAAVQAVEAGVRRGSLADAPPLQVAASAA